MACRISGAHVASPPGLYFATPALQRPRKFEKGSDLMRKFRKGKRLVTNLEGDEIKL